jgi:FlaG/FlaF family flagellin (archaellin)
MGDTAMTVPRHKTVGLSPLVAIILLIAITVAAAVVVSGVFFNLAGIAGRRPAAVIDSVKLVASPTSGAATFSIVLKNTGDVPISSTTNPSVTLTGLPAGCNLPAGTWSGNRNPGGTLTRADTTGSGCGGVVGSTIRVTVSVTFADNSQQVLATSVTGAIA